MQIGNNKGEKGHRSKRKTVCREKGKNTIFGWGMKGNIVFGSKY
jgi:hypothetical protein